MILKIIFIKELLYFSKNFNYVDKAHLPSLKKAHELFPWKFNNGLRKKDF